MTAHADPNRDILQSILQKGEIQAEDIPDAAEIVDGLNPKERVDLAVGIVTSPIQSMARKDRLAAFQLARKALDDTDEVQLPGTADFLTKFVAAIDGERDPRCLLETLPLHITVCTRLGADVINAADPTMLEELFDVVSCYFPVTYTPPASEKDPVQKSDLKDAVLICCCHPMFSEHAITFALDKVQSPVGEVKVDSLEMVERCCVSYSPAIYFPDIWSQIRTETLQAEVRADTEILTAIFSLVRSLTKIICKYDTLDIIHSHLNPLLEGILNMASLPTGFTTAKGYSALIYHVCSTSTSSLSVILTRLLPLLSGAFTETQDENRRSSIISIYNSILGGAVELQSSDPDFTIQVPAFVPESVLEIVAKGGETETLVLCSEALSSLMLLSKDAEEKYVKGLIKLCLDVTQEQANGQVLKSLSRVLCSHNDALAMSVIGQAVPVLLEAPAFDHGRVSAVASAIGASSETAMTFLIGSLLPHSITKTSLCNTVLDALRVVATDNKYQFAKGVTPAEFTQAATNDSLASSIDFLFSTLQLSEQIDYVRETKATWPTLCQIGCGFRPGAEAFLPDEETTQLTESEALFLSSQLNKCADPGVIIERFLSPTAHQQRYSGILIRGLLTRGGTYSSQAIPILKTLTDSLSVKSVFQSPKKVSGMHHKNAFLWKQKAYSCVYPALIEAYKQGGDKGDILVSILVALNNAAKTDIEAAGVTLVPILIDYLGSEASKSEGATTQAAVELLLTFIAECPSCIATGPVLGKLSPILLQAAASSPFKEVRTSSLRLLSQIASTPETKIVAVTIKHLVLPGIKKALSDHKRQVRAAAADASNSWHMLV